MNDLVILHLSDLHIDGEGRTYSKLLTALLGDIKNQVNCIDSNNIVIVVTGDIIDKGMCNAAVNAKKFFQRLKEITENKVKAIYIVPGNHDKKRTDSNAILIPAYRGLLNESNECLFGTNFRDSLWSLQVATYEESGYNDLIHYIYNDLFCMPEIGEIAKNTFGVHTIEIDEKKYCFILLNTAWSCVDEKDTRKLILGKFQLDAINEQIRNTIENYETDPAVMTFAMGHHPIECLYGTEQDALFSHLISYNNMCANVYLCGHTHDRKVVNWSNNRHAMHTLMTGFGWPENGTDHTKDHYYSIYMFNLDLNSMDIFVRRINDGNEFIPDLSIYTGSKAHNSDKLIRPIRFEEAQGAIELSAANNNCRKTVYASTDFLEYSKFYQDKLHEISLDTMDIMETYRYELYENLNVDGLGIDYPADEIDALLLKYMKNPDLYSYLEQIEQNLISQIMRINAPLIYENFQGFIQLLCQKFHLYLVEDVSEGQIVRFHFRYLNDKNTGMYSTLCSSFSLYDENDANANQPSDIKYGDLLEAAFMSKESGSLIYSVNKQVCKNKLKEKWKDYITVVPNFSENIYTRQMNKNTKKQFPLLTFGVTINDYKYEELLQCMDIYGIDRFISNLLQRYTNLFMVSIDDFLTWLKSQDKQEAS